MKVAKIRKKEQKRESLPTESYSIKTLLKILLIIIMVFGIFYFITTFLVKENVVETNDPVSVIDSTKIIVSQLLNRSEKEYYVLATKKNLYESGHIETNYLELYKKYISKYTEKDNSLPIYYIDLDNALNKKYFGNELNLTDDISELKLNDEVLFKIKEGKIEKTYVGKSKILDKLSRI